MANNSKDEKKIIIYINDQIPYMIKVNVDKITLGEFKSIFNFNNKNYKYYFKNIMNNIGVVKELIKDDDQELPILNKSIVAYIVTSDLGECHNHTVHHHRHHCPTDTDYETSNVNSEDDLDDNDDDDDDEECDGDDGFSTTTEETSVSRNHRRRRCPILSRTSSFSSVTDTSVAPNIITVNIHLDRVSFLGINLVGKCNPIRDGGVCVGSVMKGGAVDLDGRIETGDMILQVNDVNFENMSNDEAVQVIKEAAQKCGTIKFVVAKCWDPNPKNYFTLPRSEPVRPINPGAWVAHTEAVRGDLYKSSGMFYKYHICVTIILIIILIFAFSEYGLRPPSVSTLTSRGSSIPSSLAESEQRQLIPENTYLSLDMDILAIVRAMASTDSGLEIKDRMWLKIVIPNAFLGN